MTGDGGPGRDGGEPAGGNGLQPHPEGGAYRRVWTASERVESAREARPAATAIQYVLAPGEESRWHRVASEELWLWQGGGPVVLRLATGPGGEPSAPAVTLGPDPRLGHRPWAAVPAGHWQTARCVGDRPADVTCVVAPGFSWEDFTVLPDR
ncbi:cupin domain-containing protein [Streptomyces sp. TG1A-8]|uniref:cupin domain-containing protein n=1 Tax=Streptomyces sp. TG1A-8 TaxID=3051385 RepID=UPI00265C05F4|nr:cupin domain-containing protein [Streptomyces sp. TG1A-8]MDO0929330.1 cupin domain-containing protein [Streptomyces sp. TG1A-8]